MFSEKLNVKNDINNKNLNLDTLNGIADNIEEYFSNEEFLNNIKKKIYIRTIEMNGKANCKVNFDNNNEVLFLYINYNYES